MSKRQQSVAKLVSLTYWAWKRGDRVAQQRYIQARRRIQGSRA